MARGGEGAETLLWGHTRAAGEPGGTIGGGQGEGVQLSQPMRAYTMHYSAFDLSALLLVCLVACVGVRRYNCELMVTFVSVEVPVRHF